MARHWYTLLKLETHKPTLFPNYRELDEITTRDVLTIVWGNGYENASNTISQVL